MHIPNADYEDREIKRGTLMGKAHRLSRISIYFGTVRTHTTHKIYIVVV
jgi:hypothetical protein